MSYKICPVCGEKNSSDDFICKKCLSDISNVATADEKENTLVLKNDEIALVVKSGEIIGRENKGAEYLNKYPTVSRKHCQFFYDNRKWYVQDLNSSNKTYLNLKQIEPMKNIEIKRGDEISLSKKLEFKIEV